MNTVDQAAEAQPKLPTANFQETSMHTFDTPGPISLKVELWQGQVNVTATDTTTTTVALEPMRGDDQGALELIDAATVEQRGDEIVVLMPKIKSGLFRRGAQVLALITVPTFSKAKIETGSADVKTRGELGDTRVSSGS